MAVIAGVFPPFPMGALMPFIILLLVGLVFSAIPMDGRIKQIGYVVIGIVALLMLLRFAGVVSF